MGRRSELGDRIFAAPRGAGFGGADHPLNPRGDLPGLTREELDTGYLVYVFPAFTMAMRAGANNWLSFPPDGRERTRVLGGYLLWRELVSSDPEAASARAALIERVDQEDAPATTEVARTMRNCTAPRGPLSPFEKTPAQLYGYLGRTLVRHRASTREHVSPG